MTRIGPKHLADIIKLAIAQGWRVEITRKSHLRFTPADTTQKQVICSGTPSDRRALDNALGQLKRSGLQMPTNRKKEKVQ